MIAEKNETLVAGSNKVVSVAYELRIAGESQIVEEVSEQRPLQFIFGKGNLLQKFEEQLQGKTIGDNFDFVLNTNDAYGPVNQEAIVELPINVFEMNGKVEDGLLVIGNTIPMSDNHGNRFNGKVIEVTSSNVKMDFNHPLAGENLHFTGEIVGIREATEEEIEHGHLHSQGGCGCGCGCGSEKDDHSHGDEGGCGCGSGCGCN